MRYQVVYTPRAVEDLKAMDRPARALVYGWITKNLEGCTDPRWQGDGDPNGGRWRYCVGENRLIAEIEEDRIVILAVNTGLGLGRSWKKMHGGPNVFLKSTLRQPVKTAMLLLITALITFAFVSRGAEYLLVRQETERLGGFYRSTGTLQSTFGTNWADTREAAAYLEANPAVETVNAYNYTSGVVEEYMNYDWDTMTEPDQLIFYGRFLLYDEEGYHFSVDTVLCGRLASEKAVITVTTNTREKCPPYSLTVGGRYLVWGQYSASDPVCSIMIHTDEATGVESYFVTARIIPMSEFAKSESSPLWGSTFYPVPEGEEIDWSDPEMSVLSQRVNSAWDNQHALNIIPLKDMSALPMTQSTDSGIYLTEGRWLNGDDDAVGNRACVINAELAAFWEAEVGDTITLKLRDIPSYYGYFEAFSQADWDVLAQAETSTDTYEIVGIYAYTDQFQYTAVLNYAYIPASAVPASFAMTSEERIGASGKEALTFFERKMMRLGDTKKIIPYPGAVTFVLTSPEEEARFVLETRDALGQMGFQVVMEDSGWADFQAAAMPMVRSSRLNALFFTGLLAVALCLAAVIYYRMRQKDIAIARAIGVPAKRCALEAALPLILVGLLGLGAGGYLGWLYTLKNAGTTLRALSELSGESPVALSGLWLAALWCAALILLLAFSIGGSLLLAGRPVLSLLQGHTAVKEKRAAAVAEAAPSAVSQPSPAPVQAVRWAEAPTSAKGIGAAHVLRFVWRHIARAKLKSALAILLAAGFTVGLAAIRLSIAGSQEKIDWLYENTTVEAELMRVNSYQSLRGGGFIRQSTVETLLESGYVTSVYLEGASGGAAVRYTPGMEDSTATYAGKDSVINLSVRAFADEAAFRSPAGSGNAVTITYLDGWDGGLFAKEIAEGERFPVVVPKEVYDTFEVASSGLVGLSCKGFRVCDVAGYYAGQVAGDVGETDPILIPASAYRNISATKNVAYSKAHVTLDPALNRELEIFTQIIGDLSASQGGGVIALRAAIWDEELRLAVAPLENSVQLMRVLYPVTLVLSLLVAAGIAVLLVMTSAREAAIMRVLGTSRLRSRIMLAMQSAFTSAAGLLAGLAGILAYAGRTRPELLAGLIGASALCAFLYLLAAILGAAASASAVTSRNPLELLQVRE